MLDVKRVSERLMVVRVIVGRSVLNLYLFMLRRREGQWWKKDEFLAMLGEVVSGIVLCSAAH